MSGVPVWPPGLFEEEMKVSVHQVAGMAEPALPIDHMR